MAVPQKVMRMRAHCSGAKGARMLHDHE
jgi:hypothetical protein